MHGFCKLLYKIGSPEVRAATFVFEHTVCYLEYDTSKKITLDEFVNGRKRVNGTRFTEGCGFKDRANANRALKNLEAQQLLKIDVDKRDGARTKRFYRLTLPSVDVVLQDYKDEATRPIDVVSQDYRQEEDTVILPSVVPQDYSVLSPKTTQSSPPRLLDQSKYLKKVPKESTFNVADVETVELASMAPSARTSEEVHWLKQERQKMEDYLALLQGIDPMRLSHKDQIDLRIRTRNAQRTLDEFDDSHSQTPDNAPPPPAPEEQASSIDQPPAAWLPENQAAIETRSPEPVALFADALPPEKGPTLYEVVGQFFYDMTHLGPSDKQKLALAAQAIAQRGYQPSDIAEKYGHWRDKFHDLKRAGVMHFAQNIATV
jgi:hypothetical protein